MRVIQSPSKRYSGEVVLPDYLTIPQEIAWRKAISDVGEQEWANALIMPELVGKLLPGILAIVAEWHISGLPENITVDNFPMSPKMASAKLVAWLVTEIQKLLSEDDDPLA